MALLPATQVRTRLKEEIDAAEAWAARLDYELTYDEQSLSLRLALSGPGGDPYLLGGIFEDYPTLPPIWRFLHPESGEAIGRAAFPAPADPYPRGSPLIIDSGREGVVICAHFNRLAFAEEEGPHGDWGPLVNWQNPGASPYTYANTVADMLARIALETADSGGRKAALL